VKILTRRPLLGAVTACALLAIGGCSSFSTTQVLKPAQLADGVSATLGGLQAHDLVVVGSKGQPGVLIGALVNGTSKPQTVSVAVQGSSSPTQVQVPPGSVVQLGSSNGATSVVVPSLQAEAGAMTGVQLSTPSGGQVQVQAPVLPTSLPYYSTVTPPASAQQSTQPTTQPTPSGSPTSTGGSSASQSTSPSTSPSGTGSQQPTTSPS
jgi:hypothetical protein